MTNAGIIQVVLINLDAFETVVIRQSHLVLELLVSLQTCVAARRAEIDERGATAVEYALMVMFIGMAIFMSVVYLGRRTATVFNSIGNTLPG